MAKFKFSSIVIICLFILVGPGIAQKSSAQSISTSAESSNTQIEDTALAERYVPVLYFHPGEIYQPQPVDIVMQVSRLRQSKRLWFDTTLSTNFTSRDLLTLSTDESCFLDQWFGDTSSSEYANTASHQAIYTSYFNQGSGLVPRVYAHVVHHQEPTYTTIQYWLFYFYNDWFNKHEGDWELVEVILLDNEQPSWVVYSQHHGGVRRSWSTTAIEEGTHPVVYVARGSHANYFAGNEIYPFPQAIGNRQLILVDRTGTANRLVPEVVLIPTRAELAANPAGWPGAEWLMFRGRWGETAVYSDFNGPLGPADKGLQWEDPYTWGLAQPLDGETWYKNRLRVEISTFDQSPVSLKLTAASGQSLPLSETLSNYAILHTDPSSTVMAQVEGAPGTPVNVTVSWPDPVSRTVTRTAFSGLTLDSAGHADLELTSGQVVSISALGRLTLSPRLLDQYAAIWDASDFVWVGDALPFYEILAGLFLSLLISLLPVLVLVAALYWVDQYHKGPVKLLAISFAWGAVPALVVAFLVQLLIKLPPVVMKPSILEVIRLGLLAPSVEELLKAVGVLFIFWRFRREFVDVLDGLIYGALVGFGFAFFSNLFRYAGDFLSQGFEALNLSFIAGRTFSILNHGLYTAIFGACLGFAITMKSRLRFWAVILLGLVLSITVHALQNLLSNSLVGLNIFTVIVTSSGILLLIAVAFWSSFQHKRLLRTELPGLIHESLLASVQNPLARLRAQWHTLHRDGFRTWLRLRHLQALCSKLAYTQLQARLHPEDHHASADMEALKSEIARIFNSLNPAAR